MYRGMLHVLSRVKAGNTDQEKYWQVSVRGNNPCSWNEMFILPSYPWNMLIYDVGIFYYLKCVWYKISRNFSFFFFYVTLHFKKKQDGEKLTFFHVIVFSQWNLRANIPAIFFFGILSLFLIFFFFSFLNNIPLFFYYNVIVTFIHNQDYFQF